MQFCSKYIEYRIYRQASMAILYRTSECGLDIGQHSKGGLIWEDNTNNYKDASASKASAA